jgi:hypothetical protein
VRLHAFLAAPVVAVAAFLAVMVVGAAAFLRQTSLALAALFAATVVDGCGVPAAKYRRSLRRMSLTNS